MRIRRRDEGGAAAVEFGLIVPFFVVLVFGMIQYGFYFWTAETANSSARETARRIIVGHCWDSGTRDTFARNHAPQMTGSVAVTPAPAANQAGDAVKVTVTADGSIINFLPMPNGGVITREYEAFMEADSKADPDSCP